MTSISVFFCSARIERNRILSAIDFVSQCGVPCRESFRSHRRPQPSNTTKAGAAIPCCDGLAWPGQNRPTQANNRLEWATRPFGNLSDSGPRPTRLSVDKARRRAYFVPQLGVPSVKWLRAMIAVLGMCTAVLSSVALPIDDPETPYNESETPVSLATPIAINSADSIQFIEIRGTITVLRQPYIGWDDRAMKSFGTAGRGICPSNSHLKFFCTLLC